MTATPYDPEIITMLTEGGHAPPPMLSAADIAVRRVHASRIPPITQRIRSRRIRLADVVTDAGVQLALLAPTETRRVAAPGVFFIHGGGMIAGDRFGVPDQLLDWVERHGIVAASVEYRLAPENPDPAPVADCDAGFAWFLEHHDQIGIDPGRVLLWGASAGGGLAAGVALMSRDSGRRLPTGQLLDSPMLDDRNERSSTHQFANAPVWPRASNETAWSALLGMRRGTENVSPYSAPGRATDLRGLPSTYISVGGSEIFRDECTAYAASLSSSGTDVEMHVWSGGFHNFERYAPQSKLTRVARVTRERWVAQKLQLG